MNYQKFVYFETEDIWSNDPRVKKYITMAAAAYQEESRQKSEAIKWGIRQSSCRGHVKLNHSHFLGYGRDDKGNLVIIEEEAKILRLIYDLFLQGYGCRKIKKYLEDHDIKTVTGKGQWSTSTIDRILSNEKYIGHNITPKPIPLIFLQVNKKKTKDKLIRLLLRLLTKRLLAKKFLRLCRI